MNFSWLHTGLTKGSFAVSGDGSRIAWQDGASLYESEKVHVMDFNTAQKQEITGFEGDYVRVLGFVGNDLIYGFSNSGDKWMRKWPDEGHAHVRHVHCGQ